MKVKEGRRHQELNQHLHTVASMMLRTEDQDLCSVDATESFHQNAQPPAASNYY